MLGNLNPNSTTRPCTQCSKEVPKTQVLLTCDKCREKKKRQKLRRKERDIAIAEGRGKGANEGFSSAPLQAVVAKQEQETAARRASARKEGSKSDAASEPASISSRSMGMVFQAILDEHQRDSSSSKQAPKKKPTKKATRDDSEETLESLEDLTNLLLFGIVPAQGGSSSGTKRKLQEVEPNEPGTIYNGETAKKRTRGDMSMPKVEPIPQV
jgi:hypothetical protein